MEAQDKFEGVDFIIEVPKAKTDFSKLNKDPKLNENNISQHYYEIQNREKPNLKNITADRNGNERSLEELQAIQNRIMGRDPNFANLPAAKKEEIMFKEIQDWHFSQMPSLETLREEFNKPVTVEVDSLNKSDTVGVGNPHVNLKANNVRLEIASDGKTITFNNQEELQKYREAVKNQNKINSKKEVEVRKATAAAELHEDRDFE